MNKSVNCSFTGILWVVQLEDQPLSQLSYRRMHAIDELNPTLINIYDSLESLTLFLGLIQKNMAQAGLRLVDEL